MAIGFKNFSAQIKQKYPEYAGVDDSKLARAMLEKFPVYVDQVTFEAPEPAAAPETVFPAEGPDPFGMEAGVAAEPTPAATPSGVPVQPAAPVYEGPRVPDANILTSVIHGAKEVGASLATFAATLSAPKDRGKDEMLITPFSMTAEQAEKEFGISASKQKTADLFNKVSQKIESTITDEERQNAQNSALILLDPQKWQLNNIGTVVEAVLANAGESISQTALSLVPYVGPATMVGSEGGRWVKQAEEMGVEDQGILSAHSVVYGVPSGLIETYTNRIILKPLKALGGKANPITRPLMEGVEKVSGSLFSKVAVPILKTIASSPLEGVEEVLQGGWSDLVMVSAIIKQIEKWKESGDNDKISDMIPKLSSAVSKAGSWKGRGDEFILGTLAGLGLGGAATTVSQATKLIRSGVLAPQPEVAPIEPAPATPEPEVSEAPEVPAPAAEPVTEEQRLKEVVGPDIELEVFPFQETEEDRTAAEIEKEAAAAEIFEGKEPAPPVVEKEEPGLVAPPEPKAEPAEEIEEPGPVAPPEPKVTPAEEKKEPEQSVEEYVEPPLKDKKDEAVERDGFKIYIENKKGSERTGTDPSGKDWSITMQHDYGEILGVRGKDKDYLDVFIEPDSKAGGSVFVVDQVDPKSKEFDEHKVMMGFSDKETARKGYLANYEKGWKGLGGIVEFSQAEFQDWVSEKENTQKPAAEYLAAAEDFDFAPAPAVSPEIDKIRKVTNQDIQESPDSDANKVERDFVRNEIAKPLGRKVVFVKGGDFEGVSSAKTKGLEKTIFINEKTKNPIQVVAVHEITHSMREESPREFALLANYMVQNMTEKGKAAFEKALASEKARPDRQGKTSRQLQNIIIEEQAAEFLGDQIMDPAFLEKLAKQQPTLFKRFARKLIEIVDKITGKVSEKWRSQLLNLDVARDKAMELLGVTRKKAVAEKQAVEEPFVKKRAKEIVAAADKGLDLETEAFELSRTILDIKGAADETSFLKAIEDSQGRPRVNMFGTGVSEKVGMDILAERMNEEFGTEINDNEFQQLVIAGFNKYLEQKAGPTKAADIYYEEKRIREVLAIPEDERTKEQWNIIQDDLYGDATYMRDVFDADDLAIKRELRNEIKKEVNRLVKVFPLASRANLESRAEIEVDLKRLIGALGRSSAAVEKRIGKEKLEAAREGESLRRLKQKIRAQQKFKLLQEKFYKRMKEAKAGQEEKALQNIKKRFEIFINKYMAEVPDAGSLRAALKLIKTQAGASRAFRAIQSVMKRQAAREQSITLQQLKDKFRTEKALVKKIKGKVVQYAREIGLMAEKQNRVVTLVRDAKTEVDLFRAIGIMDETLEVRHKSSLLKVVREYLKGVPKNVPLEYKRRWKQLADKYSYVSEGIQKKLNKSIEYFRENPDEDAPERINEIIEALTKKNLADYNSQELKQIIQQFQEIRKTGKLKRELVEAAKDRQRAKDAVRLVAEVGSPVREAPLETVDKNTWRRLRSIGYVRDSVKKFGWDHIRTERIINWFENWKPGIMTSRVFKPILEAEENKFKAMAKADARFKGFYGGVDLHKAMSEPAVTLDYEFQGQAKTKSFTINEMMFAYGNSQNADNRAHLEATMPASMIDDLIKALPDNYKRLVDAQIDYYDNTQYGRINKVFSREYDVDMPRVERYFPIANLSSDAVKNQMAADLLARHSGRKASIEKGFTRDRATKDNTPFASMSYFDTVINNMMGVEHYISYQDAITDVNKFLNLPEVKGALEAKSREAYGQVRDWLDHVAFGKMIRPDVRRYRRGLDRMLDYLRHNYVTAVLGFNVVTMLKQPASFAQGIKFVKKKYVVEAIGRFTLDQKIKSDGKFMTNKLIRFVQDRSVMMANRANNIEREFAEQAEKNAAKRIMGIENAWQKVRDYSMMPIQMADMVTTTTLWYAKYQEQLAQGKSEEAAAAAGDALIRRTQPMGGIVHLAGIYRGGGLARAWTLFTNQLNQNLNLQFEEFDKLGKTGYRQIPKWVQAQLYFAVIPSAMLYMASHGGAPPWEDPEGWAETMVANVFAGMVLVGKLIDNVMRSGMNVVRKQRGKMPESTRFMQDMAPPAVQVWEDMAKAIQTRKPGDLMQVASRVSGLPYAQAARTVKGVKALLAGETADKRSFIWSRSALKDKSLAGAMRQRFVKHSPSIEDRAWALSYYLQLSGKDKEKFRALLKKQHGIDPLVFGSTLGKYVESLQKAKDSIGKFDGPGVFAQRRKRVIEGLQDGSLKREAAHKKLEEIKKSEKRFNDILLRR